MPWVALGVLWAIVVDELRVEWTINPQYSYGWAIPFLCSYLVWKRWKDRPSVGPPAKPARAVVMVVLLAFLFLPLRLIQTASPEWRVAHWTAALIAAGITLLIIWLPAGQAQVRHFSFPILYFLVAVPWMRPVEGPVIQSLTRANAATTIELLSLMGVPAIQHGNVIEVGTGVVGIDDACSGIRSFQATLMISLLLGELYRLTVLRRIVLCLAGFALSFVFNVGRTGLLTWVAARDGVGAISQWHDPAGVTILVGCFIGLWAIGAWLRRSSPTAPRHSVGEAVVGGQSSVVGGQRSVVSGPLSVVSALLLIWLLLVELGVEGWYRWHERGAVETVIWAIKPPASDTAVVKLDMPVSTRESMRYTEGQKFAWSEPDGTQWQVMYFRWAPGSTWVKQVTRHPPPSCLSAVGWNLVTDHGIRPVQIGRVALNFHAYTFLADGRMAHVFYCLWEDGAKVQPTLTRRLVQADRIQSALQGRRNPGMRVLELAVWGIQNAAEAEAALRAQLATLIKIEETTDH